MPVTEAQQGIKPPVHEQIADLQKKIQLLESDRKASSENSQWEINKNNDLILKLRQENKKMHQTLADAFAGEEEVINAAFQEHQVEQGAVKNKTGEGAILIVDHRLCETVNQLNQLKYQVEMRKQHLEELQLQYSTKEQEINEMHALEEGDLEEAKILRMLENRLEKARFKNDEAVRITSMYQKLKAHMQEKSLHFQNKLDALQAEISHLQHEFKELESVEIEAQDARNTTREQLQIQEENIYGERKARDKKLKDLKKLIEEKRAQNERTEKRSQKDHVPFGAEELRREPMQGKASILKNKQALFTASEAFEKIRATTGVADADDVIACFVALEETFKQLENMKDDNEKSQVLLREEKNALQREFEHEEYSGEARKVGAENLMKELCEYQKRDEKRQNATQEELDKVNRFLLDAKAGVEHLASKVQHIKLEDSHFASTELDEKAPDYVLDLLAQTEEKFLYLLQFLKDRDKQELLKRIEEVEFHTRLERKLPAYNTRVKLPMSQKADIYDEEDSGEDDADVVTRTALKRQSQQIIESKTKRRTRYRKKDGKM
ncbi:outer dynein arm-docking complex subunit 3 [Anolis carolinensis]|uniref:Outer dynein arm docking complex subunit 3 n=1 Tax=Anolis carolinensis TaxID=28377 RepID=G1KTB1_ANOCA|nr:PREDICTED: coiled-coil domain-containing protein 151 isoform X1 [Anolis carolinensis]|eukprot:XP_003216871.1 PREDICTED: coiled-coil domain-containing protein 151 isoform X1 [Anolis carolinensis]